MISILFAFSLLPVHDGMVKDVDFVEFATEDASLKKYCICPQVQTQMTSVWLIF
jgi:hypothetical protein